MDEQWYLPRLAQQGGRAVVQFLVELVLVQGKEERGEALLVTLLWFLLNKNDGAHKKVHALRFRVSGEEVKELYIGGHG